MFLNNLKQLLQKPKTQTPTKADEEKKPVSVAKVFCDDDDDDDNSKEEMPLEAKMKMRNVGRYVQA